MIPVSPVCAKLASFFNSGAVSGGELEKIPQKDISVIRSFDSKSVGSLSLNCVSDTAAIAHSLFEKTANGGLCVAAEETVNTGGIIDEVIHRRKDDIEKCEQKIRSLGWDNIVTVKIYSLINVICKDGQFILNLQEKVHRTALFVFDIEPEKGDIAESGCKEARRQNISPEKIAYVIVPEKYKDEVLEKGEAFGIPLDKVIFVGDTKKRIRFSYKDAENNTPSCETEGPIVIPDYESALDLIAKKFGDIKSHPLFTHMTRLPE